MKMINQLKEDIIILINKSKIGQVNIDTLIIYFICMKYLCEKGTYDYEEVINYKHLYEINQNIIVMNRLLLKDKELYINKLLKYYSDVSAKDLLLEYLNLVEKPFKFDDGKSLFIGQIRTNSSFYDINGKTTYVYNKVVEKYYNQYKLFDEILGINNYYKKEDAIGDDYKYLYVHDDTPRYRFNRNNNEYTIIDKYIDKVNTILLYTNYNKISNIRNCGYLLKYIKYIIIDGSKAVVIFNKEEATGISIINYDKLKIDENKLKKIINNNRRQKDILIKVSYEEIRKNNYRIGFNLYQLENSNQIKDINKIVDENTKYLEKLNRINQTVENEVNKFLNK